jgi:hypothetical protein
LLAVLTVASGTAIFFLPRISQDAAYHGFADQRTLLAIPNFLNVVSNLPFAVVGVLGLMFLFGRIGSSFISRGERWPFVVFFLGVALTSIGSSYYHLAPSNERLVWDRLPMTLGFMSIFAAVIEERVSRRVGRWSLAPLLLLGLVSVFYWHMTESAGSGDLRLYAMVQFYPLLAIPLILALFPPLYTRGADLVLALAVYGLAKVLELADRAIYAAGEIVSGHSLKHLAAAAAAYLILCALRKREPISSVVARVREAAPSKAV